MTLEQIEAEAARIRGQPVKIMCLGQDSKQHILTIAECVRTGSRYIHVVDDALDKFLDDTLGGDSDPIERQKRTKSAEIGKEG